MLRILNSPEKLNFFKQRKALLYTVFIAMVFLGIGSCKDQAKLVSEKEPIQEEEAAPSPIKKPKTYEDINVSRNVRIAEYFKYIDSLVVRYDSVVPYPLSEHLLVRNNPWIDRYAGQYGLLPYDGQRFICI
ncbi:hypothetical protein ACU8V7_21125 [Zobellia nedashkovskayae]